MEYRKHAKTGDRISVIGMGTAYLWETEPKKAAEALTCAFEGGINYFDLAAGGNTVYRMFAEALGSVRDRVLYQIHFGNEYSRGEYGWTLELDAIRRSVDWQLRTLGTDFIDYGFIHCQDELSDWETYRKNGVLAWLLDLHKAGVVRHLGLSSHTPAVVQRILDEVNVDTLMFSVNPAYDYAHGEYARGGVDERAAVYRRCEKEGIGITVMKPFSGGQLLDAKTSPFGTALTPYQCIRYALDKPGVLSVLPGAKDAGEVKRLLGYFDAPEEETDYAVIGSFAPPEAAGKCVYCGHCKPCPMGLDIGLINKYYDLARVGDGLAAVHYRALDRNASDCVGCGHCDERCPFGVRQSERMQEIAAYFG